jgi:hypothetical protein
MMPVQSIFAAWEREKALRHLALSKPFSSGEMAALFWAIQQLDFVRAAQARSVANDNCRCRSNL